MEMDFVIFDRVAKEGLGKADISKRQKWEPLEYNCLEIKNSSQQGQKDKHGGNRVNQGECKRGQHCTKGQVTEHLNEVDKHWSTFLQACMSCD